MRSLPAPLFPLSRPVLLLACVLSLGAAAPAKVQTRAQDDDLTLAQRYEAQRRIERVWYEHRIWPNENPQPKPIFEAMVSAAVIDQKARDPLLKTAALKRFWNMEITPAMLQDEMDRMVRDTKDSGTLRELFAALDNDPRLIAETLARDQLSDQLIHERYARDPALHAAARRRAEAIFAAMKSGSWHESTERNDLAHWKETILLDQRGPGFEDEITPDGGRVLPAEKFAALRKAFEKDAALFQERDDGFAIRRALSLTEDRLEIETSFVPKLGFDLWWAQVSAMAALSQSLTKDDYHLPAIATTAGCDTWTPTSLINAPSARAYNTGVWSGAEMIIWGDGSVFGDVTGGRYYPATDSWLPTSVGANVPSTRYFHTAVWTGKEMIIWGGKGQFLLNTGSRYNPVSNSWTRTSMINVPGARAHFTGVWTGGEMIVWGGGFCPPCSYNTDGGRYNPATDSWLATSVGANVPSARYQHTAVWTGSEMIIWGGQSPSSSLPYGFENSGGRYNPATDSWIPTAIGNNLPQERVDHSAVWTGNDMIIWSGDASSGVTNTGGRYNPLNDNWMPTSTGTNTPSARSGHTAIWTGGEMIIWGVGIPGGRYNPSADVWTPTSIVNVPSDRTDFSAVWTGGAMIIWGGGYNTGGVYTSGSAPSPANTLRGGKSSSITLNWTSLAGVSSYNVKRCDPAGAPCTPTTIVATPTTNQYSEPNDALSHFYAVESVNACGATP